MGEQRTHQYHTFAHTYICYIPGPRLSIPQSNRFAVFVQKHNPGSNYFSAHYTLQKNCIECYAYATSHACTRSQYCGCRCEVCHICLRVHMHVAMTTALRLASISHVIFVFLRRHQVAYTNLLDKTIVNKYINVYSTWSQLYWRI